MNVKIIGAGSIGNHLARACVRTGWTVTTVDQDPESLRRMREEIYPRRYGQWEDGIALYETKDQPRGGYDVIFVATPPDVRMAVALEALAERPRVLQLEKPLCAPTLDGLDDFLRAYTSQTQTIAVVGYNHAVSRSIEEVVRLLRQGVIGAAETLDVEFREHWRGIFAAHPWLRGPQDSYLGYWRRGGGAASEHSHALHLWHFLAPSAGIGSWSGMAAFMDMRQEGGADYDALTAFTFLTDRARVGRVVQDVITFPARKRAFIQGSRGFIEWLCNGHPSGDVVRWGAEGADVAERVFQKTREDDFLPEVAHIGALLRNEVQPEDSPLSLASGAAVMRIVAAAHSRRNGVAELEA